MRNTDCTTGVIRRRSTRGYTLVEIMIVATVSLLLMTIVGVIYSQALRVYEESQGLTLVYETAKLINSDMRNYLGYVVPVPGNWIDPKTYNFPGQANASNTQLDDWYFNAGAGAKWFAGVPANKVGAGGLMENNPPLTGKNESMADQTFSYAQFPPFYNQYFDPAAGGYWAGTTGNGAGVGRGNGNFPNGWFYNTPNGNYNMSAWASVTQLNSLRGWWMPAFFGRRQPATVSPPDTIMKSNDINAGSWGWPRADYRMDVDLDNPPNYCNKVPLPGGGGGPVISCWFYAENRVFNSSHTMALDNSNIVLVSMKFSFIQANPNPGPPLRPIPETTQLSILKHSIVGFDLPSQGLLRSDETTGSMIRAIKITPYWFNTVSNKLVPMTDADLNSTLAKGAPVNPSVVQSSALTLGDPGFHVPRAFDVEYVLRNPYTFTRYSFALRIFCQIDPLALPSN